MKKGKAKAAVMQRRYRMRVVEDKRKYSRKTKHKKASFSEAFLLGRLLRNIIAANAMIGFSMKKLMPILR